jgi:hypothetical protein
LRKGELSVLPGKERVEEAEGMVGADGFKTYTTPQEGRPRRFPPNNE